MLVASNKFFVAGAPAHCALCDKRFDGKAYRGGDRRFYCSQFCATDADMSETPVQCVRSLS